MVQCKEHDWQLAVVGGITYLGCPKCRTVCCNQYMTEILQAQTKQTSYTFRWEAF